jgi:hypothetical protein
LQRAPGRVEAAFRERGTRLIERLNDLAVGTLNGDAPRGELAAKVRRSERRMRHPFLMKGELQVDIVQDPSLALLLPQPSALQKAS